MEEINQVPIPWKSSRVSLLSSSLQFKFSGGVVVDIIERLTSTPYKREAWHLDNTNNLFPGWGVYNLSNYAVTSRSRAQGHHPGIKLLSLFCSRVEAVSVTVAP